MSDEKDPKNREGAPSREERLAAVKAGAKITAIKEARKDATVLKIEVDGKVIIRLHRDDFAPLGIAVNDTWTDDIANRLRGATARTRARNVAKTLIEKKQLPKAELVEKLTKRGHDPEIVRAIVDDM